MFQFNSLYTIDMITEEHKVTEGKTHWTLNWGMWNRRPKLLEVMLISYVIIFQHSSEQVTGVLAEQITGI